MGTSDDLDPRNTDNLHDDGSVTLSANTRATALVELSNGRLILITTERESGHDGMASFEIDNDPGSASYGQVVNSGATDSDAIIDSLDHGTHGGGYDNIESLAALTLSNGNSFVYSADPLTQAIGITQVAADGTLTALPPVIDGMNLNNVGDIAVTEVGGQPLLLALAGGSSNNLLSYTIDAGTGALTQVSDVNDGSGSAETFLAHDGPLDASFLEAFTDSTGTGFVLAGSAEDGISLFTIDATGTLGFEDARGDDAAGSGATDPQGNDLGRDLIAPAETGLTDVDAAAFTEIDGRTYAFVGGGDNDVTVFRIDPASGDGSFDLTLVGFHEDLTEDISAMQVIRGADGDSYLVAGGEQQGLQFVRIDVDPDSGVVTLDMAGAAMLADENEPGAELWDVEDLAYHDGILVSASDLDDGVAVMTVMICFAAGTQMMTEFGEVPVQDLRIGDRLLTRDNGFQPIRWIGTRRVSAGDIDQNPGWRPVRVARDAFGPNVPSRNLRLSRQHRVLVVPAQGDGETLLPIKDCLELPGVQEQKGGASLRYFHMLLPRHEIVFANGQPCETLWPGDVVKDDLSAETGFPELDMALFTPARPFLKGRPAREFVQSCRRDGATLVPARYMRLDISAPRTDRPIPAR